MVDNLSTSDWAFLAVLYEAPTHGFRLAGLFASDGELGFIWTIQRPQIYRTLEHLEKSGLAVSVRQEESEAGPPRTVYQPNRASAS
jgi:DNA-binding PadR family transcriptional regulator